MSGHTPPAAAEHEAVDAQRDDARVQLSALQSELSFQERQQQALAFGLSHDLRAPLRAIDSFAVLLGQHAQAGLDDTARGYLQRIRAAAARMGSLLDGLNDLSAAGRVTPGRELVDLSMLADWVGAELGDTHAGETGQVDVAPGLTVEGDEHYLKLMLAQLLDNAWKFSRGRERIHIVVEGEAVGERVRLRVRDQGIGFDMQYAERMFEPFRRLHGVEEGAGPGLGLAIAQCIAQRHGGSIRAESTPGLGSVFHVELPHRQDNRESAHG